MRILFKFLSKKRWRINVWNSCRYFRRKHITDLTHQIINQVAFLNSSMTHWNNSNLCFFNVIQVIIRLIRSRCSLYADSRHNYFFCPFSPFFFFSTRFEDRYFVSFFFLFLFSYFFPFFFFYFIIAETIHSQYVITNWTWTYYLCILNGTHQELVSLREVFTTKSYVKK